MTFDGGAGQILGTLLVAGISDQVMALDDRGRADLLDAAEEELGPYTAHGELRAEVAAHILLATV